MEGISLVCELHRINLGERVTSYQSRGKSYIISIKTTSRCQSFTEFSKY
jgi:hypothetical protein